MKQKVRSLLFFGFLSLVSMFSVSVATSPNTYAYICTASQSVRDSYGNKYVGMTYRDGSCYVQVRRPTTAESTDSTGIVTCKAGDQRSADGRACTKVEEDRSETVPLNDDGTPATNDSWKCDTDDEYGKDGRHICYDSACGFQWQIPPVACGRYYDPKENKPDPTSAKVKDCTSSGATYNTATKTCDHNPQTCAKTAQGVWDPKSNSCKLYSDYTNKADCDAVGGQFKVSGKDPAGNDIYTCVKPGTPVNPNGNNPSPPAPANPPTNTGVCGSSRTVLIPSGKTGDDIPGCKPDQDGKGGMDALLGIVKFVIGVLNVGVGVIAVGGIVFASLLYASARENASQTQQAIGIIRNTVVGLLLYIFMVAILNWLLPGGVLQ